MSASTYIPAMGRHRLLFLYRPFTRLAGLRRVHGELLDRAGVRSGHRVLEIGCGPGDLLTALGRRVPEADLTGIDPDPAALRLARRTAARRRLAITYTEAFAGELPFPDGSFDRVLSSYMLHHLTPPQKSQAFLEVRRVLRPDGELHVVDAHAATPGSRSHPLLAANAPDLLLTAMRDAGFPAPAETGRAHRRGPLGTYAFYRAAY
ncbi:class I SAM-dependent methyltransferase [Actinoplanes sp. NPDC051851]|uniref:class I SAM-dependent methyltransferase n=1 Tax=Actinoplanes sp. NPDC051851 TaxID=3154753 RepID=UPI00343A7C8B